MVPLAVLLVLPPVAAPPEVVDELPEVLALLLEEEEAVVDAAFVASFAFSLACWAKALVLSAMDRLRIVPRSLLQDHGM